MQINLVISLSIVEWVWLISNQIKRRRISLYKDWSKWLFEIDSGSDEMFWNRLFYIKFWIYTENTTRSNLAQIEKRATKIRSRFRGKFIIQSKFCAFWIIRSAFKVVRRQRVIVYQSQSPIIHEIERKFSHEKISETGTSFPRSEVFLIDSRRIWLNFYLFRTEK